MAVHTPYCYCCCCCQADLHAKLEDPTLNLAIENHEYGMPPGFYDRWPILKQWYNILTTSKDRDGIEYISTMEAKKYPFTGVDTFNAVVYFI
jgi:gamma-glutamyl hydrolase